MFWKGWITAHHEHTITQLSPLVKALGKNECHLSDKSFGRKFKLFVCDKHKKTVCCLQLVNKTNFCYLTSFCALKT